MGDSRVLMVRLKTGNPYHEQRKAEHLPSAHRRTIEEAMAQHLVGAPTPEPDEKDRQAGRELVGLLIESLSDSVEDSTKPGQQQTERRYLSLFGDGLAPVFKDVLGDNADPALLVRCIDGFWGAIRARETTAKALARSSARPPDAL